MERAAVLKAAVVAAAASASFLVNGLRSASSSELTARFGGNSNGTCATLKECDSKCNSSNNYIVNNTCSTYTLTGSCTVIGTSTPCGTACTSFNSGSWTFACN